MKTGDHLQVYELLLKIAITERANLEKQQAEAAGRILKEIPN
jgi:hypothetical protein